MPVSYLPGIRLRRPTSAVALAALFCMAGAGLPRPAFSGREHVPAQAQESQLWRERFDSIEPGFYRRYLDALAAGKRDLEKLIAPLREAQGRAAGPDRVALIFLVEAKTYEQAGRFFDAQFALEEAVRLESSPESRRMALLQLARMFVDLSMPAQACERFEQAALLCPQCPERNAILEGLGEAAYLAGKHASAVSALQELAARLSTDSGGAFKGFGDEKGFMLADALYRMEFWSAALDEWKRMQSAGMLSLTPEFILKKADCLLRLGRTDEAVGLYLELVAGNGDEESSAMALIKLGDLYPSLSAPLREELSKRNPARCAEQLYQDALSRLAGKPTRKIALRRIALSLESRQRFVQAVESWRELCLVEGTQSDRDEFEQHLASCVKALSGGKQCMAVLEAFGIASSGNELAVRDEETLEAVASCAQELGLVSVSGDVYRELGASRGDAAYRVESIRCYLDAGDLDKARSILPSIIGMTSPGARFVHARVLAGERRYGEALDALEGAPAATRDQSVFLASVCARNGDWDRTERLLDRLEDGGHLAESERAPALRALSRFARGKPSVAPLPGARDSDAFLAAVAAFAASGRCLKDANSLLERAGGR